MQAIVLFLRYEYRKERAICPCLQQRERQTAAAALRTVEYVLYYTSALVVSVTLGPREQLFIKLNDLWLWTKRVRKSNVLH